MLVIQTAIISSTGNGEVIGSSPMRRLLGWSQQNKLDKQIRGDFIGIVEEWKPLMYGDLDLTDRFLISNTGKLYSLISKKILKPVINKKGYETTCVSLGSRQKKKLIKIHKAVAYMFVSGYKTNLTVNHKDGNKLNNYYTNLEWITVSENLKHAHKTGLMTTSGRKKRPIKQIDITTNQVIQIYNSIAEAGRKYKQNKQSSYSSCNISKVLAGIEKTAYGYKWEYL